MRGEKPDHLTTLENHAGEAGEGWAGQGGGRGAAVRVADGTRQGAQ